MEPIHVYALLHSKATGEERRAQLEQYFVARDHARSIRRERIRRLRSRFAGQSTPAPTIELAVEGPTLCESS